MGLAPPSRRLPPLPTSSAAGVEAAPPVLSSVRKCPQGWSPLHTTHWAPSPCPCPAVSHHPSLVGRCRMALKEGWSEIQEAWVLVSASAPEQSQGICLHCAL